MATNYHATHYRTGEDIRAGDRVSWAGRPGTVVFVLGSADVPAEWADPETWPGKPNSEGFMLDVTGAGLVLLDESDEDLEFLGRQA